MRKTFFAICLLIVCITACKRNSNNGPIQGAYTEVTPVEGDITLNFVSSTLVIKTEKGSAYKDSFTYVITPGKIQLKATRAFADPMDLDFEQTDANTIKMTNLHPTMTQMQTYMTLKR